MTLALKMVLTFKAQSIQFAAPNKKYLDKKNRRTTDDQPIYQIKKRQEVRNISVAISSSDASFQMPTHFYMRY